MSERRKGEKMLITVEELRKVREKVEVGMKVKILSPLAVEKTRRNKSNKDVLDGTIAAKNQTTFLVKYKIREHEMFTTYAYKDLVMYKPEVEFAEVGNGV